MYQLGETVLDLLLDEASQAEFHAVLQRAEDDAATDAEREAVRRLLERAGSLRARLDTYRRRTTELTALYDTAGDLTALRDVDKVIGAIVRRSRQLLGTDLAYLMLMDEHRGDTYMRAAEGALTSEFLTVRLPLGTGLGGLVAETAAPMWTADYLADDRFVHTIDDIIAAEALTSILGVPLRIGQRVIGVLFAADRSSRSFAKEEASLLSSLGAHAAIAIENAALFEEAQRNLRQLGEAHEEIERQNAALRRGAELHERLTAMVLEGAPISVLASAVEEVLGGRAFLVAPTGRPLTDHGAALPPPWSALDPDRGPDVGPDPSSGWEQDELLAALERVASQRRSVETSIGGQTCCIAPAMAGAEHLGSLVFTGRALDDADTRALERAAMVTALLLLDRRASEDARNRARGELLAEMISGEVTDPAEVRPRADALGVPLHGPVVVAEAVCDAAGPMLARAHAEARAVAESGPGLVHAQGSRITVLVRAGSGPDTVAVLARRLTDAAGQPVTVGGCEPFERLDEVPAAHRQASRCAKVLRLVGRTGEGATPAQLGLYALLLSETGREQLDTYLDGVLGPLLRHDEHRESKLVPTLQAYFAHGCRAGATAKSLYIHPNTLYQRLERIDQLLGDQWRSGDHFLQLHLAIMLHRLRMDEEGTSDQRYVVSPKSHDQ
ncbi:helix-turn-helix domain-containing protein [Haloechinothrix sp. LS1_15]|uniref:helix-turn-helix domain-containing protein n=1 Tax=Haloechinothrix sp. LS1_15 TaxID=2652248 RepID=UPI0029471CE5|nr:helix-turn-helix domain-containing protein [Haloechinothrix sp. LS1_15]MDV6010947.1 GAF domain-containing protein [Haloechinothrix sp. LS1_15]